METNKETAQSLWIRIKEVLTLKYEYARLTLAEKLTMLLTMLVVGFATLLLLMITLFFMSVALAEWMALSIGMGWSCLIVAGIYLVLVGVLVMFRKQLVADPLSRFITKLML